jgi:hypothetical protein
VKSVFRKSRADKIASKIPVTYNPKSTRLAYLLKNIPTKTRYTGKRALHDMKGTMSIVIIRLLRLSMVRVDIMAGTLHPKPMMSGMNDLPCNPILCISLSMIKAVRDI